MVRMDAEHSPPLTSRECCVATYALFFLEHLANDRKQGVRTDPEEQTRASCKKDWVLVRARTRLLTS